jgi:hypothetical protein
MTTWYTIIEYPKVREDLCPILNEGRTPSCQSMRYWRQNEREGIGFGEERGGRRSGRVRGGGWKFGREGGREGETSQRDPGRVERSHGRFRRTLNLTSTARWEKREKLKGGLAERRD